METPTIRLVNSPDPGARVFHDLNDPAAQTTWVERRDEFTLGEPTWFQTATGIMEGTREITIPLAIMGERHEALARVSAISRTLMRRDKTTWLEFKLPGGLATHFRLREQQGGELDFGMVRADQSHRSLWRWNLQLTTDAWGIGPRIQLDTFTVAAQQANMGVLLAPDIEGDVPAPLNIDLTPNGGWSGWQQLISVIGVDQASSYVGSKFWVATSFTPTSPANFNGASIEFPPSLGASTTGGEVLSGTIPATVPPGTYKCMVLARRNPSTTGGGGQFRSGTKFFSTFSGGDWVSWQPSGPNDQSWVDTGELTLPGGLNFDGMADNGMVTPTLAVRFKWDGEASGIGGSTADAFSIDGILLIPVDMTSAVAGATSVAPVWDPTAGPSANATCRVDSDGKRVGVVAGGVWHNLPAPAVAGGVPILVHPDARNYLTVLNRINPTGPTSSTGDGLFEYEVAVTASYRPRYLHIASR